MRGARLPHPGQSAGGWDAAVDQGPAGQVSQPGRTISSAIERTPLSVHPRPPVVCVCVCVWSALGTGQGDQGGNCPKWEGWGVCQLRDARPPKRYQVHASIPSDRESRALPARGLVAFVRFPTFRVDRLPARRGRGKGKGCCRCRCHTFLLTSMLDLMLRVKTF